MVYFPRFTGFQNNTYVGPDFFSDEMVMETDDAKSAGIAANSLLTPLSERKRILTP
jgi:hypothetical protein